MQAGFYVPPPAGDGEQLPCAAWQAGVVSLLHDVRRRRGMEVDRHAELHGGVEDGGEAGIVEEQAVSRAVDHRADKAQLQNAALELVRGFLGLFRVEGG